LLPLGKMRGVRACLWGAFRSPPPLPFFLFLFFLLKTAGHRMHSSKWPRYGGPFGYALTRSGRPGRGSSMRAPQFQLMPCGARHSTRDTQPRAGAPRCQSCKGAARFWRGLKCALMPHKRQISPPEI
jgi:hypothetical protein